MKTALITGITGDEPLDLVLATGNNHSVEEFCSLAFACADMPLSFSGEGKDRVGTDGGGVARVRVDPSYYRPTEVDLLVGDPTLAEETLGWKAETKLAELVKLMVEADMMN